MPRPATVVSPLRLAAVLALSAALPAAAGLQWDSLEASIKIRAIDSTGHARYGFVNSGASTITISGVNPGCGCTVPALAKNTYAPGERGELTVDFHPGSREGLVRIPIAVTTDDDASYTLQFIAQIETVVSFDTRFVFWKAGESRTPKSLRLSFAEGQTGAVTEVKSNNPQFAVAFRPAGNSGRDFDIAVTPPAQANDYTSIEIRILVGTEKTERSFVAVARTMNSIPAATATSASGKK